MTLFRLFPLLSLTFPCLAGPNIGLADPAFKTQDDGAGKRDHPLDEIFQALGVQPGSRVADIGAGASGSATFPLARIVGRGGRVWAVDIDEKRAIPQLKARVRKEGVTNVEVIAGLPGDPKLPDAELDAVLIMNAYHEMEQHNQILARVFTSLRSGGRLVIVDNTPRPGQGSARGDQEKKHVLAADFAESDLRAAGFSMLTRQDELHVEGHGLMWMIVAERPAK